MDGKRLDETAEALSGSRRAALTSGAALALGGLLTDFSPRPARARTKLKQAHICPPPQPATSLAGGADYRAAQSFTATRSGTLRTIKVELYRNSNARGDFVVQLLKMAGDVPSSSPLDVIAAATVPDAQVKGGRSTLVTSFGTTRVEKDTRYAVAVSEPGSSGFGIVAHLGDGSVCEGTAFSASGCGAFTEIEGSWDMAVAVLVA